MVGIVVFAIVNTIAQKLITPGYQFNSDPTCREIGGRFYLFTTQDPFTAEFETDNTLYNGMYDYHAYSTVDFDHWVDHGSILTTHDAGWGRATIWDGDAGIPANGKFYAYAPFRVSPDRLKDWGHFEIGVFVADMPEGPYVDALGKAMTTVDGQQLSGLSPTIVRSDNGAPYLLWGGDNYSNSVHMARLKPSMLELAEPVRTIQVEIKNRCGGIEYIESPILFKYRSLWYLTYVAENGRQGRNCNYSESDPLGSYVQYATSKSMFGPFDQDIRHLIYPSVKRTGNVAQGVCQYKGQWYLAYHIPSPYQRTHRPAVNNLSFSEGVARQVAITKLTIRRDGSLMPIHPDADLGVGTPRVSLLTLDAFAQRREAQEFYERKNADEEQGLKGEYHFKMKDNGYLRFNRIDFADGASGFRVEVSSEFASLMDGQLEFRIDHLTGRIIAKVAIYYTGAKTNYTVLNGTLVSGVSGIHDVYLIARGSNGDKQGHLFNLAWFTFTRSR